MITRDGVIEAGNRLGWSVSFEKQGIGPELETYVEFRQSSPAGEDFSVTVFYEELSDIVEGIYSYWQDFDIEEHVEMWIEAKRSGVGGVPDVVTLVDDAKEIDGMLEQLFEEVSAL